MPTTDTLKHTPFFRYHVQQGAKLVDFAGWEMPMLYRSIIEEHRQVRGGGGVFDVSHMGRLRFSGPDAARFLDQVCTRKIEGMADGQCRYSLVCNERGGCRDDVLVYRLGDTEYLMVCNAANREKLLGHFSELRGGFQFELNDETLDSGMLAIQGPKVMDLIAGYAPEVPELKRYRFVLKDILGAPVIISRTGYTGEDGVEVIMPAALAEPAVNMLVGGAGEAGSAIGPAGLGARDTLRMEAGMPLYGHEITETLDPLSAGLDFAVKLDKDSFIGRDALARIAGDGPQRRLRGLVLEGRRTARQDMPVRAGGNEVGTVTSACLSPTLGKPIAMAYLDTGTEGPVEVTIGQATVAAQVVPLPFYKK